MMARFTAWLWDLMIRLLAAIWDVLTDVMIGLVDALLSVLGMMISAIPAPDFLTHYALSSLLNRLPEDVLYFVSHLRITEAFTLIASGFAFRMARKILTLGQW